MISAICSSVSARKTMISSIRLMNSGSEAVAQDFHQVFLQLLERLVRRACCWMRSAPRFEVMITTAFLKSTVRPCASVRRPSSRICSRMLKTSAMRLLDLVEEEDGVRATPHLPR